MKTKQSPFTVLLLMAALLGACGPSPEQIATMTASAWTPTPAPTSTPLPTPTATLIPYDLAIKVMDESGVPIDGAIALFAESGSDVPVLANAAGQITWSNLSGPNGKLTVTAQGYFGSEQSLNLERGPNETVVTLERDPFGVLPADACASNESLLYVEDFQDSLAQGMGSAENQIEGWSVGPSPDDPANIVLGLTLTDADNGNAPESAILEGQVFGDAVWRLYFYVTGHGSYIFNWHEVNEPYQSDQGQVDNSSYFMVIGTRQGGRGPQTSAMVRIQPPLDPFHVIDRSPRAAPMNIWNLLEMSTFEGVTKVWLNGIEIVSLADAHPLPAGHFSLSMNEVDKGAQIFYDNMVVCGLNAPFVSNFSQP